MYEIYKLHSIFRLLAFYKFLRGFFVLCIFLYFEYGKNLKALYDYNICNFAKLFKHTFKILLGFILKIYLKIFPTTLFFILIIENQIQVVF